MTPNAPDSRSDKPFDPFDFVQPCEPDCTGERHAYHQGQWDMAGRINEAVGFLPHPGASERTTDPKAQASTPSSGVQGELRKLLSNPAAIKTMQSYTSDGKPAGEVHVISPAN